MHNYKLGDKVEIFGYSQTGYKKFLNKVYKFWYKRRFNSSVTGIIVRKCWKRGGIYYSGGGSYSYEGDYESEPPYLDIKKQYLIYEVAININKKSILVPPNYIKLLQS